MNRISLNQNTCKDLSLFDFLKRSKDFRGVELNFKSINEKLSDNIKLKDIMEVLETYDLAVTSIFRLKDLNLSSDHSFNTKILRKFNQMIDYCYKLESDSIISSSTFCNLVAKNLVSIIYNGMDIRAKNVMVGFIVKAI